MTIPPSSENRRSHGQDTTHGIWCAPVQTPKTRADIIGGVKQSFPGLGVSIVCLAALLAAVERPAQPDVGGIKTVPEKTSFRDTSTYADVMAFLEAIDKASPAVHLTTFGATQEKRALPLAVVGAP